jgi:hypothetical protein
MGKNSFFFGQPIFSQMINLIDGNKVARRAGKHSTDRYCKRFTTFQHLITMVYGAVSGCNSLRGLCSGIVSYGDKIAHCKFDYSPRRSTLADANMRRGPEVFEAIYGDLFGEHPPSLSDSHKQLVIDKKVYAIDSTTIGLFQPIFECTGRKASNGRSKGGIKSHQKLDMQAGIPVKVHHSDAREHDSLFIQREGVVGKGEVALFDKAYNNYALFDKWNGEGTYFVTRLKNNAKEQMLEELELPEAAPDEVMRDAKIALKYRDEEGHERQVVLRSVSYFHPHKNKAYYFPANLFDLPAERIAHLYKQRWQIELLFKKIKQNFPLQYF